MTEPRTTPDPDPAAWQQARQQLLGQWREARRRRDSAPLGGEAFRAAAEEIARLEVEIARLDRSMGRG